MKMISTVLGTALAVSWLGGAGDCPVAIHSGDKKKSEEKPMLYSDDEARKLFKPAEAVVPNGETRAKNKVFEALNIDPKRLRDRRVVLDNLVRWETWQISEGFDITWMAAIQDPTPLEKADRQIYGVRVVPRVPPGKD